MSLKPTISMPMLAAVTSVVLAAGSFVAHGAPVAQIAPVQSSQSTLVTEVKGEVSREALWALLKIDELIEIMQSEGTQMALDSDQELLGRDGGQGWRDRVAAIYTADRLHRVIEDSFVGALDSAHLAPLCAFYERADIQQVVALELSARRAFMDPEIEARARANWLSGQAVTAHEDAIFRFIDINDLVERNVMGALNSNYAFLRALYDASPDTAAMITDREILSEVWSQEVEIRRDTSEWLLAYLGTAYSPLSAEVLEDYVHFSESPAGRALNSAIFQAFDSMYLRLSRELGAAVGQMGNEQEL